MLLIWGQKTYCRKAVTPVEIGFPSMIGDININKFELTQRYAHFYWIPLFPIGKKWHARARDGQLYTISGPTEQQLNRLPYSRASVLFAFAWPIIIILCMLGYQVLSKTAHHYRQNREAEVKALMEDAKANAINAPSTSDYYHFIGAREQYAKVSGSNSTDILLTPAAREPKTSEPADIVALFADTVKNPAPVWVSKKALLQMADPKSDFDTALFGPGKLYLVELQHL